MTSLVLRGGRVFTAQGDLVPADVALEGETIVAVAPGLSATEGAAVLDLDGRVVMPGFVNLHSHLTFYPGAPTARRDQIALRGAHQARRALEAGITTVRDVGGVDHVDLSLRDAIQAGQVSGPRMLAAGQFLCITGGHSYSLGRQVDGPDGVRHAVREQVRAGADLIKLMGSGGVVAEDERPEQLQFTDEELRAGIDEAHRHGRPAAVHAHPHAAIEQAVRCGADFIEHASFLREDTIELLLKMRTAIVPTCCVYARIAKAPDRPSSLRAHARRILETKLASVVDAVRAGVRWGIGLDNGTYYPPDDYVTELELLVTAGLRPREVLLAATVGNAALLGLDGEIGSVSVGKMGDLVIIEDDPLVNLSAARSPWLVLRSGKPVTSIPTVAHRAVSRGE